MVNFRLGIGDILLLYIADRNGIGPVASVELPLNILADYRNNSCEYKQFIDWMVPKLFNVKIEWKKNCPLKRLADIQKYKWEMASIFHISPEIFGPRPAFSPPPSFIIVSTKFRFDGDPDTMDYKEQVAHWAENFSCKVPIILLGEKQLEPNLEVQMWNHQTVYKELLPLEKHNTLIDLTVDTCNNTPKTETFLRDIWLFSQARCSLGFGYGGNFVISSFFCQRSVFLTGAIKYNWKVFGNHGGLDLCKTFESWNEIASRLTNEV